MTGKPQRAPLLRRFGIHAVHVLTAFASTLAGMVAATKQPVTRDLIVSLLPAAAVATLRALEARSRPAAKQERQA